MTCLHVHPLTRCLGFALHPRAANPLLGGIQSTTNPQEHTLIDLPNEHTLHLYLSCSSNGELIPQAGIDTDSGDLDMFVGVALFQQLG